METSEETDSQSDIADSELPLDVVKRDDLQAGSQPPVETTTRLAFVCRRISPRLASWRQSRHRIVDGFGCGQPVPAAGPVQAVGTRSRLLHGGRGRSIRWLVESSAGPMRQNRM